jgi:hypothetical protein
MAVVQISRIQVRRGKANTGTGIPQLASGELAWAVDTQELYIGSGAVSEGAPAVDNIKVITEVDLNVNGNILNLLQYIYKIADPGMQTGATANTPITRSIQNRLDDRISLADFIDGTYLGDGITDVASDLQRAIDQLFLNTVRTKSSDPSVDGVKNRVILNLPAGVYNIGTTLYIPSYATIVGEGDGKTIINFSGNGPAFQFINDQSTPGNPSTLGATGSTDNPRYIIIKGLTINTSNDTQSGLQLDAVSDSVFENITINGVIANPATVANSGIVLNAKSSLITCEDNIFRDVTISNFSYAVFSNSDIRFNTFRDVYINNCHNGYDLGRVVAAGQLTGPRNTVIEANRFYYISQYAVYVGGVDASVPLGNTVRDCKLNIVGNDIGNAAQPVYPQIYFRSAGNTVDNIQSDRTEALAGTSTLDVQYMPEVTGSAVYKSFGAREISLSTTSGYQPAFRLPVSTDEQGNPVNEISYVIEYVYRTTMGTGKFYSRRGTMKIVADLYSSIQNNTPYIQLTDDYEFTGDDPSGTYATDLDFKAVLVNIDGTDFINSSGYPLSIEIRYASTVSGGSFAYSYVAAT